MQKQPSCSHLPLYMDGARLITALACPENELTLTDIARLCDIFYIGGTKAGALCGEAVVFTHKNAPAHFLTLIKQHGALLAKGRLCGVQFDTLFTGDLYKETGKNAIETASILREKNAPAHFLTLIKQHGALLAKGRLCGVQFDTLFTGDLYKETGKNAIETASILREGLKTKGYTFYNDSPTNQLFLIMENTLLEKLKEKVVFSFWEKADDTHTVIRFATSWATSRQEVETLLSLL